MANVTLPGGSKFIHPHDTADDTVTVYGPGTVIAGSGNDAVTIEGRGFVRLGSGRDTVAITGDGTVRAGSGDDSISLGGDGRISLGAGHDTITLGSGSDTIFTAGQATVTGAFGAATIAGGKFEFLHLDSGVTEEIARSGQATLLGGSGPTEFVGGRGSVVMQGGTGSDTFVGGSGHDTMIGGSGGNLFEFLHHDRGGQHVIQNFVSGQDQLYLEGRSLAYLQSHGDISSHGGNTYIALDGGRTTIELKGVTGLTSKDVTTHKP